MPDPMNPSYTRRKRRELAKDYFEQNPWGQGYAEDQVQRGAAEGPTASDLRGAVKKPSEDYQEKLESGAGINLPKEHSIKIKYDMDAFPRVKERAELDARHRMDKEMVRAEHHNLSDVGVA